MTKKLNVLMNGVLIGKLEKTPKGELTFMYEQSWVMMPGSRPLSLSLPLHGQRFTGDVVYNYFDNLLPDNLSIRARIQSKFKVQTSHPFDLLGAIGSDCVGAIKGDCFENIGPH